MGAPSAECMGSGDAPASARFTKESTTQGRRNPGGAVHGHESRQQKSRERHPHRACPAMSERQGPRSRNGPMRTWRGWRTRIYEERILDEHVQANPVMPVEPRPQPDDKVIIITPAQPLGTLKALPPPLHLTLVRSRAAAALGASALLALRWR